LEQKMRFSKLMKGPTEMPAFSAAGYNTSKYAYPDTLNGNDVFFNQFDEIELPVHTWDANGTQFEENPLTDKFLVY